MSLRLWDVRVRGGLIQNHTAVGDCEEIGEHMKNLVVLTQKDCYHGEYVPSVRTAFFFTYIWNQLF